MMTRWNLVLSILVLAARAGAQSPSVAYESQAELEAHLRRIVATVPGDAPRGRLVEIAKSFGGRSIFALEVGAGRPGPLAADERSGVMRRSHGRASSILIVGGVAGERLLTTAVAVRIAEKALSLPESEFASLYGRHRLLVVPRLDPDGSERFIASQSLDVTGNGRSIDADRDGRKDEDSPDDLDGDGIVVQMLREVPDGTLIKDPEDDRKLIAPRAEKGERGRYVLSPEGRDDDGDGDFNEDGNDGVRIGRNFPHAYDETDLLSGAFAVSEPETKGLVDYMLANEDIEVVIVLGANDNLTNLPEAAKGDGGGAGEGGGRGRRGSVVTRWNATDRETLSDLAKTFKDTTKLTGQDVGDDAGSLVSWAYFQRGVLAIAINPFEARKPSKGEGKRGPKADRSPESQPATTRADAEAAPKEEEDPVAAAERTAYEEGFVAWHAVDHTALGKIEIGGWIPGRRHLPSLEVATLIADRIAGFVGEVARRLSRTEVASFSATKLGQGVYALDLRIVNTGALPTAMVQGTVNRELDPLLIELDLDVERVLQGRRRISVQRLEAKVGLTAQRWVVRGEAGEKIVVKVGPSREAAIVAEVVLP